jgi:hypothetical protein
MPSVTNEDSVLLSNEMSDCKLGKSVDTVASQEPGGHPTHPEEIPDKNASSLARTELSAVLMLSWNLVFPRDSAEERDHIVERLVIDGFNLDIVLTALACHTM